MQHSSDNTHNRMRVYVGGGGVAESNPHWLLNFQPPLRFTFSPHESPLSPRPSFWPQVVFRDENAQNDAIYS